MALEQVLSGCDSEDVVDDEFAGLEFQKVSSKKLSNFLSFFTSFFLLNEKFDTELEFIKSVQSL